MAHVPPGSWLARTPIAHRGLHDAAAGRPENSLAAFEHACALGFPIELDVRLTSDRAMVVFHDRTLDRMTGVRARVDQLPVAEVAALPLAGTAERVPLLRDALDLVAGRVPLLLHLKREALSSVLQDGVRAALRDYPGEVAIQAFQARTLWQLRRRGEERPIGRLSAQRAVAPSVPRFGGRMLSNHVTQPEFLGCRVEALPGPGVRYWRARGLTTLAWTVRSPAEAAHAMRWADNYIFEGFVPALNGSAQVASTPPSTGSVTPET
jgi:glycerophosphoryl diester phosphodiesterase